MENQNTKILNEKGEKKMSNKNSGLVNLLD